MTQHDETTLDLSSTLGGSQAAKRAVASEIGDRLERVGGMMITGHGISTSLIAEMRDAFRAFFGQPAEYKTRLARPETETVARGYVSRMDVRETDPGMERFSMGEFTLPGLLKIKTVKKPARKARKNVPNPFRPGETMDIAAKPASTQVKVQPLKGLKELV